MYIKLPVFRFVAVRAPGERRCISQAKVLTAGAPVSGFTNFRLTIVPPRLVQGLKCALGLPLR